MKKCRIFTLYTFDDPNYFDEDRTDEITDKQAEMLYV
jgi:hypothetical protein